MDGTMQSCYTESILFFEVVFWQNHLLLGPKEPKHSTLAMILRTLFHIVWHVGYSGWPQAPAYSRS
jgi:hypothetical protein